MGRRRRGWRCRRRRRRWRRAALHRQAGDDVLCVVARIVFYEARREAERRERGYPLVAEGRLSARHVTVIEVKGKQRVDVVANTGDRLIAEIPAVSLQEGATQSGIRERRCCPDYTGNAGRGTDRGPP